MKHGDLEPDNKRNWLADAMAGDFSTMPVPFTWDESAGFAHVIDGYGVAGGVSESPIAHCGKADVRWGLVGAASQ